jgi:hypothetical protein
VGDLLVARGSLAVVVNGVGAREVKRRSLTIRIEHVDRATHCQVVRLKTKRKQTMSTKNKRRTRMERE